MLSVAVFAGALGLSIIFTGWVRRFAMRAGIEDHPNHRSLHTVPTPRGGGVAIVLGALWTLLLFPLGIVQGLEHAFALAVFSALMAWLGWMDDRRPLGYKIRLIAQFAATAIFLGMAQPTSSIVLGLLLVFGWVWMINLTNFMDGIDGIAASQAFFASVVLAGFSIWRGSEGLSIAALGLAGACLGFLKWNWAPARIFMGDVGSYFLGFYLGGLALLGVSGGILRPASCLILYGCFFVDATWTLFSRAAQGRRVTEAHRDHAYQHAVRKGVSHSAVVLAEAGINFFWLLPLVFFSESQKTELGSWLVWLISVIPLLALCFKYKAGTHEATQ